MGGAIGGYVAASKRIVELLRQRARPYLFSNALPPMVTAAGAVLLALVFARLSRLVPRAGGPYAFSREGFGDFAGFVVAWRYWISIWVANAALGVAFTSYLSWFWPVLATNRVLATAVGIGAIWLLTWVNVRGVRTAGSVQVVTTVLSVGP